MGDKPFIVVVHLIWLPYGIEKFKKFLHSYQIYRAGKDHQLILLFNGVCDNTKIQSYCNFAKENSIEFEALILENGQDIDAYYFAAQNISADLILFLNTNSIILSENWLQKMYANIIKPNVAMVAATASFQSYSSSAFMRNAWYYEKQKSLRFNFRKYKLFIKSFFYYRLLFRGFPNPHLRTNGFMIWRDIFLNIKYKPLTSKMKAYQFESGRNSLSNQILKMNKKLLVVDKFGNGTEMNNWYESKTFWSYNQENLLVSDNQTEKYMNAGEKMKKVYTFLAWGKK